MSAARQLIDDAHREGASFHLVGDHLRLVPIADNALSSELIARAKALRSEIIELLTPPAAAVDLRTDEVRLQIRRNAERRNAEAIRARTTDRFCTICGGYAAAEWPLSRFRAEWRCPRCAPIDGEG